MATGGYARRLMGVAAAWVALAGCGLNVERHYQRIRPALVRNDALAALAALEQTQGRFYGENSRLLFLMDRAMVQYMAGSFVASNQTIDEAKDLAQALWTQSISKTAQSWVGTDNQLPYQGEDFERVMLHLLAALNYLSQGQPHEARVEARQWVSRLELYNRSYDDHPNRYADDAFARWLAGRLRVEDDEPGAANDAWIDLKRSLVLYRRRAAQGGLDGVPQLAVADAARVLDHLGGDLAEEKQALRAAFGARAEMAARPRGWGSIALVHLAGEAPFKVDDTLQIFTGRGVLRIAVPRFVVRPQVRAAAVISAPDAGVWARAETMQDVAQVAVDNLEDHLQRIRARAVARALSKHAAGIAVGEVGRRQGGTSGGLMELGGLLWNLGHAVAEEADKRSWITLPARIDACSMDLPAGRHTIHVALGGGSVGAPGGFTREVEVRAGATTFLSFRTLP